MDASELYDTDFVLWTEQQAAAIRRLGGGSNSLDIEHLAEEIEDLGKRDVREVESSIKLILLHALKIASDPADPAVPHWRAEIVAFQQSAAAAFAPSMRQMITVDQQWLAAARIFAESRPKPLKTRILVAAKMTGCPVGLDDLLTPDLDLDALTGLIPALVSLGPAEP